MAEGRQCGKHDSIGGRVLSTTPIHLRRRQMSAPLSHELFEEYKTRSIQVREGDTVTVMRGNFAGVEGKVTKVNHKKATISIDGVTREKTDGTSTTIPIHPSKVTIKNLNLDDKRRKEILERKSPVKVKTRGNEAKSRRSPKVRMKTAQEDFKKEANE